MFSVDKVTKEEAVLEILSRVTSSFGGNLRSIVLSDETSKMELVPSSTCCDTQQLNSIASIIIPCRPAAFRDYE